MIKSRVVLEWREDEVAGLSSIGLSSVWTELNDCQAVVREIGFDNDGQPIHFAAVGMPGVFLFDGQIIADKKQRTLATSVDQRRCDEFVALWQTRFPPSCAANTQPACNAPQPTARRLS